MRSGYLTFSLTRGGEGCNSRNQTRLDVGRGSRPHTLSLEHVSLEDLTEDSREYLRSSGTQVYTSEAFWSRTRGKYRQFGRLHAISDENQGGRRRRLSESEQLVDEWQSAPDFRRGTWCDFMALCYNWGDRGNPKCIIVNGQEVQVTQNLHYYLQAERGSLRTASSRGH